MSNLRQTNIDTAVQASEQIIQQGETIATLTDLVRAYLEQHTNLLHLIDPSMARCECDLCALARETLTVIEESHDDQ